MSPDLIELIETDAVLVRQSFFTLAVEKAQEKLKKFQLPNPRYYITQIMQALLASGATDISITTVDQVVTIDFDGPGYEAKELATISDAVFESGKNRERDRIRELALGLLSVQGLNPKKISIASQGSRWEHNSNTPAQGQVVKYTSPGNQIKILHSRNDTDEVEILRNTCQSCKAEIRVNDISLTSLLDKRQTSCPWPNYGFSGKGFSGAFGIAYGDLATSHLTLTRYGVTICKRNEKRIQPTLIIEMEHTLLRKDASQSDVVEDENYSAMLTDLQQIQIEFALDLSTQRIPSYQNKDVFTYFQNIILRTLSPQLLNLEEKYLSPLETRLCNTALLLTTDGRRCSVRQAWSTYQEYGKIFYSPEHNKKFSSPPGTCLALSDVEASAFKVLFPRCERFNRLNTESFSLTLKNLKQRENQRRAPSIIEKTVETKLGKFTIAIPEQSEQHRVDLIKRTTLVDDSDELTRIPLGKSPLDFYIISPAYLTFTEKEMQYLLQNHVEPIYQQLSLHLGSEAGLPAPKSSLLQAYLNYLRYRYKDLARAFQANEVQDLALFLTVKNDKVSISDLRAWLAVYDNVIITYGTALNAEDQALATNPEIHQALAQLFGPERILLANIGEWYLLKRGQQAGLSGAAKSGVKKAEVFDEEAELAAIRKEIEEAKHTTGLQVTQEVVIDETAVMQQLGINPQNPISSPNPSSLPKKNVEKVVKSDTNINLISNFAQQCRQSSNRARKEWQRFFQLPGIEGLIFINDGAYSKPLANERLLVKYGSNEPVTYPLPISGISGWMEIPQTWSEKPDFIFPPLRADANETCPISDYPLPKLGFDLEFPQLNADLAWTLRTLFLSAAQKYITQMLASNSHLEIPSNWVQRFTQFVQWDKGWASASSESLFFRLPLLQNLAGQSLDIYTLRQLPGPLFCASQGSGHVAEPYKTIRLLPSLSQENLEYLIQKPLELVTLQTDTDPKEQLMNQLKLSLVQTCQRSLTPLESEWVDSLNFGAPEAWFKLTKKYFIKHDKKDASTLLNPADTIFVNLFNRPQEWPERIPVLASAVYTAINRALEEVEDHHELAYLEAMLAQL